METPSGDGTGKFILRPKKDPHNPRVLKLAAEAARGEGIRRGIKPLDTGEEKDIRRGLPRKFAIILALEAMVAVGFIAALTVFLSGGFSQEPQDSPGNCSVNSDCKDKIDYRCRNDDVYKYSTLFRCSSGICREAEVFVALYDTCKSGQYCVEGGPRCRGYEVGDTLPSLATTTLPALPAKCSSKSDCPPDQVEFDCNPDGNVVEKSTKYLCALYSGSRCIGRNTTKVADRCGPDETCVRGRQTCQPKTAGS